MGEARRRRLAAEQPHRSVDELPWTFWAVTLQETVAAVAPVIAAEAGSTGICRYIAELVWRRLMFEGVYAEIVAGALLYRAGPDPLLDTIAFCGARNVPTWPDLCHTWVEARARGTEVPWYIDYSPPGWKDCADVEAARHLPPVQWVARPPAYYAGPKSELVGTIPGIRHCYNPPLGKLWVRADHICTRKARVEIARNPVIQVETEAKVADSA